MSGTARTGLEPVPASGRPGALSDEHYERNPGISGARGEEQVSISTVGRIGVGLDLLQYDELLFHRRVRIWTKARLRKGRMVIGSVGQPPAIAKAPP